MEKWFPGPEGPVIREGQARAPQGQTRLRIDRGARVRVCKRHLGARGNAPRELRISKGEEQKRRSTVCRVKLISDGPTQNTQPKRRGAGMSRVFVGLLAFVSRIIPLSKKSISNHPHSRLPRNLLLRPDWRAFMWRRVARTTSKITDNQLLMMGTTKCSSSELWIRYVTSSCTPVSEY